MKVTERANEELVEGGSTFDSAPDPSESGDSKPQAIASGKASFHPFRSPAYQRPTRP